jgi:putative acetyltransferase
MNAEDGEIKSMHTLKEVRGSGVGSAMLRHIMERAQEMKLKRLFLETGSFDYFAPARALYARHGFLECPPFADYNLDRNSTFMSREL